MLKPTIRKAELELHDTCSNHVWHFAIDYLAPSIVVSKNGVVKATFNSVEYPTRTDYLMELTEGL